MLPVKPKARSADIIGFSLKTVGKFRTVRKEGKRNVTRQLVCYSLDVIISAGYRLNSKSGTQFRIWANKVLKDYLLKGYDINNRINRIEDNVEALSERVNEIDVQVYPPHQPPYFNTGSITLHLSGQ